MKEDRLGGFILSRIVWFIDFFVLSVLVAQVLGKLEKTRESAVSDHRVAQLFLYRKRPQLFRGRNHKCR